MTDKTRQQYRTSRAPHGSMSNWSLAVFAAVAGALALILANTV